MTNSYLFTLPDVKKYAENFLKTLKRENVTTLNDLEANVHSKLPVYNSHDLVLFEKSIAPYTRGSFLVTYICLNETTPLQLRFHSNFGNREEIDPEIDPDSSDVVVSANVLLSGYKQILLDTAGNIIQIKKLDDSAFY